MRPESGAKESRIGHSAEVTTSGAADDDSSRMALAMCESLMRRGGPASKVAATVVKDVDGAPALAVILVRASPEEINRVIAAAQDAGSAGPEG